MVALLSLELMGEMDWNRDMVSLQNALVSNIFN